MAKIRITDLTATSSLSNTHVFPVVNVTEDVTYKITALDIANTLTTVSESISASYALTSSYAYSSSYALTSSHAITASNALNGGVTSIIAGSSINVDTSTGNVTVSYSGGGGAFPFTGSAQITASSGNPVGLGVTGSISLLNGSLLGTSSWALNVVGAAATGDKISSGSVTASVNVGGSEAFKIVSASSTLVYVSASGNVGIGTTSPASTLHVDSTNAINLLLRGSTAASYNSLRLYNDQNSSARALEIDYAGSSYAGALLTGGPTGESAAITTTGNYPLSLGTNNSARINITGTGNVGIGVTSPATALDVGGIISLGGNNFATSSANYNIVYTKAGNAGIYLGGAIDAGNYHDNSNHVFRNIGGSVNFAVLNTTGLAVGKDAPTQKLDVNGNVSITGSLVVSGSNGAGVFSQGATLVDYVTGISSTGSYMVWRAPFSCSVVALYGYYVGGTAPNVNALRSGSSGIGKIVSSDLNVSSQNIWVAATTANLQNKDFNAGDALTVIMSGSSNNQLAVQVDFIRKF